jgi:DNA-binding LacI/PurR family transcriptional regulator
MRLTGESIAKQVGCSVSTVSRVLNNSASVSLKTRQAVLEAMRASGSVPKVLGRRGRRAAEVPSRQASGMVEILMVRRSAMEDIGIVDDKVVVGAIGSLPVSGFFAPQYRYANSFYRHIVDGAVDELQRFKHRSVLNITDTLAAPQLISEVNAETNRGLILMGDFGDDVHGFLQKVTRPVVSLMSWPHAGWPDYVGIDNALGISLAFDHLYDLGHRRIGYVACHNGAMVFRERLATYKTKLSEKGLPFRPEIVCSGSSYLTTMEAQALEMLSRPDRPSAVLCGYDGAAVAVGRAAGRLGLSVPGDLSVVGFDDEDIGQLFTVPLTTVRVPCHEMGRRAVQLLMMRRQAYAGDRDDGCSIRVTPTLKVRESTAPPG